MAAVLGHEFGGFQSVGSQHDPIAGLFQHAADEFADADGIVRHNHDALVLNAVDGIGGDGAFGDGGRPGSENPGGGGGGGDGFALVRFDRDHAVEVEQKNEAAVGSDRGAGKKLDATQILAERFDHDFVLAEHFFDHQP